MIRKLFVVVPSTAVRYKTNYTHYLIHVGHNSHFQGSKWLIFKLFETIMSLSAYIAVFKLERVYLVSDMIHLAGVFVCVCVIIMRVSAWVFVLCIKVFM